MILKYVPVDYVINKVHTDGFLTSNQYDDSIIEWTLQVISNLKINSTIFPVYTETIKKDFITNLYTLPKGFLNILKVYVYTDNNVEKEIGFYNSKSPSDISYSQNFNSLSINNYNGDKIKITFLSLPVENDVLQIPFDSNLLEAIFYFCLFKLSVIKPITALSLLDLNTLYLKNLRVARSNLSIPLIDTILQ